MFSWRHFVTSRFLSWVNLTLRKWFGIYLLNTTNPFLLLVYTPQLYHYVSTQDSFQCSHVHFPIQNLIVPLHYVYFHIWMSFCACKIGLWMYFLLSQFNVGGFQLYLACLPYRCKRGWIANSHHFKDKMFLNDNYK